MQGLHFRSHTSMMTVRKHRTVYTATLTKKDNMICLEALACPQRQHCKFWAFYIQDPNKSLFQADIKATKWKANNRKQE